MTVTRDWLADARTAHDMRVAWAEKHSAPMLVRITRFNGKYTVTGYVQQPARSHTVCLPDERQREWMTGGGLGKCTRGFACLANAVSTFRELRNYDYACEPSWIDRCFAIHDRWPEYAARRAHRYAW